MKTYTCICGKIFHEPQKFNGHKQGCSEHIINKYGSLDAYYEIKNRKNVQIGIDVRKKTALRKAKELQDWIDTFPTCEKCGKIMSEKFGSGRFCSRSCANGRLHTEESKRQISNRVKQTAAEKDIHGKNESVYLENPDLCPVCGKPLTYEQHNSRKTCSVECGRVLQSRIMVEQYVPHDNVHCFYKFGTYHGIRCDSSWELALVLYCEDHGIKFTRNKHIRFPYIYDGEQHYFYPDFLFNDTYVEVKGQHSDITDAKIAGASKHCKLVVLYGEDLEEVINYCKTTYGVEFYTLYDRAYPSWMDRKDSLKLAEVP